MKKILIAMLSVIMLTSCSGGKTVATVGKTKITQGEFEFYLSSIKNQMNGTELQTEEDWETREIEGEKAIDVAKRRALDNAIKNAEYCEIAELAGLSLTEEEKKQADDTKKRIIIGYGGDKDYNNFLKNNDITDKFIDMMCKSTIYHNKISAYVLEKTPVTEEAIEAKYRSYMPNSVYRKAKHILFLTVDPDTNTPLSDEKIAEAKTRAEQVYAKVRAGGDFDALMNEYSEDVGLKSNPDGYVFSPGKMVAEFEQAVNSVNDGEITFCESDYGYHIIKRLPVELDDMREILKQMIADEMVESQVSEWETEYGLKITKNEEILKEIK